MSCRRLAYPREPESDATEEEEDVYTDIAATAQPEECVTTGQWDMEQDDEDDCRPHQLTAVSADITQFYQLTQPAVSGFVHLSMQLVWYIIDYLGAKLQNKSYTCIFFPKKLQFGTKDFNISVP